ncbi:DUF1992 domain-containing protein [Paenibacillus sp. SAF-054]|uniref:DnaJ family domain-containing protein n=1 Tax=unclassified Paenibacillus TaxID=185978 RepID=UPI003F7D6D41
MKESQRASEEKYRETSAKGGLVESAVDDFAKKGGFDDLPGKGKPLNIGEGDVLTSIMKNANYVPPWIEQRKEIAADIKNLTDRPDWSTEEMERRIENINQKIRRFNRLVPNPLLQKGLVSAANIERAYEKWL